MYAGDAFAVTDPYIDSVRRSAFKETLLLVDVGVFFFHFHLPNASLHQGISPGTSSLSE